MPSDWQINHPNTYFKHSTPFLMGLEHGMLGLIELKLACLLL